ncbi:MAG: efflux RND transporter periplasmic adaptor subunit [Acidobacteriota bacterium]
MKYVQANAVAALALSLAACADKGSSQAVTASPLAVSVAPATVQEISEPFEAGGVIRARVVARVVSRIMARVESIRVAPGDWVRAGQALVLLDGRDLNAHRESAAAASAAAVEAAVLADADSQAAEAALNLARVTFERIRGLRASQSATQQEYDVAETELKAAESRLKVAQARSAQSRAGIRSASAAANAAAVASSFATLVAPFDGLVTEKLVEPGNMAAPGMPLVTVEDTRSFRLEVRLDESRATLIAVGDRVEAVIDGPPDARAPAGTIGSGTVSGRVVEIARMLDPGSHDFLVKIDLPRLEGVRSGMFARAVFRGPVRRALAVPVSAVVRRGQLGFVFVVEDGRARLRLINGGEAVAGLVEARAGLVEGDPVVTLPPPDLVDGRSVSITGEKR